MNENDGIATPLALMKIGEISATANYETMLSPPPPSVRASSKEMTFPNDFTAADGESKTVDLAKPLTPLGHERFKDKDKTRHRPFSQSTRESSRKRNGNIETQKHRAQQKADNEFKSEIPPEKTSNENGHLLIDPSNRNDNVVPGVSANASNDGMTSPTAHQKSNGTGEEKNIAELKQTIRQLQEQLEKKEARIKTLETSNQSIRNTLLITKNQYFRLQEDYNSLQKRIQHNRTHSFGLVDSLFFFFYVCNCDL
ncbi:hypothetical protein RFI_19438 [Reticulomyxa filosa]|uniref:Uncharacterized protein n=1 Tax=Reticulomyxa filosa TaxID=46433 RepID=X6MV78_RETFI|nr:hypothetical protein RFI_19438 [Reticulomyxa filosa]|eukprot:ETO17868.1 hypothetical protein RFI_19438 [Reticulomyxa filosa]